MQRVVGELLSAVLSWLQLVQVGGAADKIRISNRARGLPSEFTVQGHPLGSGRAITYLSQCMTRPH